MSTPRSQRPDALDSSQRPSTPSRASYSNDAAASSSILAGAPPPTYAAFSPATLSTATPSAASAAKRRSTILVHQKSPLLLATPPQVTRALAYSHPFLLPLNKLLGLLTWTTEDQWESFLMLCAFWASVLYGDVVVRVAGPLVLVLLLIGGMYGRRFSPLSSSGWSEPGVAVPDEAAPSADSKSARSGRNSGRNKTLSVDGVLDKTGKGGNAGARATVQGHTRNKSSASEVTHTRHQKTLDEIVETLKEFTARCNILLEPFLELTDFLSTQRTPTSATTRPALTTLFVRILLCTPFWFLLTLPPLCLITTRRVIIVFGTILLTWHSRHIRVTRAILWRSATIRKVLALITGLQFEGTVHPSTLPSTLATGSAASGAASTKNDSNAAAASKTGRESELTKALRRVRGGRSTGVRFTFIIYENQRRWIGLGWTTSLFAYERPAWTDEHNNAVPPRDEFELPEVEDGSNMRWQWAEGSRWRVDGVPDEAVMNPGEDGKEWDYDGPGGRMGWVYYDNKWQNGRRGTDGWGRWTRRRKWYRDAELVEVDDVPEVTATVDGPADGTQSSNSRTPTPKSGHSSSTAASESIPTVGVTPSSPATGTPPGSLSKQRQQQRKQEDDRAREREDETHADAASLLSTSSRSARFGGFRSSQAQPQPPPPLRRRITATSAASAASSSSAGGRSRRASAAASIASEEDDAAAAVLGTQARIAAQTAGANEAGSWGVGDEVRMGLE